jgi:hypothetical protein
MKKRSLFACACLLGVLLGCSTTPSRHGPLLPEPRRSLVLEGNEGDLSLGLLLDEFAQVTDQRLVMAEPTRKRMMAVRVPVEGRKEIPPDEVYSFVEALLVDNDCVTARVQPGNRPKLGVFYLPKGYGRMALRTLVSPDDLDLYTSHPAFLIETVLEFDNLDINQTVLKFRDRFLDTSTQKIIKLSEREIAVGGTGTFVAEIAALLIEENEKAGRKKEE